jgi:hypothetical protein
MVAPFGGALGGFLKNHLFLDARKLFIDNHLQSTR